MIIINVCKFFYLLIECFLCCKLIQICAFILQGIEVTLHQRIVVQISCFAHALCHIYRFAKFGNALDVYCEPWSELCRVRHSSDQGSQFTSNEYKRFLKGLKIRQSMDSKGCWADNIIVERWFRSLKTEEIYINEYQSPRQLRKAIAKYIDIYNSIRPHQALNNHTPNKIYEESFLAAA